ncbi:MAG TPA: S9 family peptidase [Candidatus Didemnitutus sp.]|jgi:dipeptidyl aminopeptidase/acylaminoacyl peptidase
MKMFFAALVGFLVLTSASATEARHTITHEDVWLMKRVGSPVPSPDGKWVVFSVTEPAYEAREQWSDLWIKSLADDSAPRRITYSKSPESGVSWSPDSRRIAFSAKREGDEVAQIYVLPLDGGEAERWTNLTLGAHLAKWSPDGSHLLFLSDVFPGAADEAANKRIAKERKERKYNVHASDQFPPRFWNHWLDDKKPHLFVQDARAGAEARDILAGTKLAGEPGFGGALTDEDQVLDAEWTPDGLSVVFTAAVSRDEATHANVVSPIFLLAISGGEPQRLTPGGEAYRQLSFSPDGRALLAVVDAQTPGKIYDLEHLAVIAWPFAGAAPRILAADFDQSVSRYAMPAGADRVFFTSEHTGVETLYSVALSGGEVRPEQSPATGCLGNLRAGGTALVGTWESAVNPPEVFALGGSPRPLTAFSAERSAKIDWSPVDHFWFTSSRGKKIHNMLVKPAGFDPAKKYPLLLVIHGGAASMWKDAFVIRWNYHLLAAPGYVVLLTDYSGSTGYGEEFARSIQLDPLKGPGDELNEAVDYAIAHYSFVDSSRLAAAGASYGGHLANWLEATTTRFKCIVSHAGEADLVMQWGTSDSIYGREVNSGSPIWGDSKVWREQSPVMQAGNHDKGTGFVTPILITDGEMDFRVPMNNSLMFFTLQQRLGVPSRLLIFPEENHWILKGEDSRYWYGEVQAWLAKWMK